MGTPWKKQSTRPLIGNREEPKSEVTVKFFTTLREILGKKEDIVELADNSTIEDLLRKLSQKHGDKFIDYIYDEKTKRPRAYLQFLIDSFSIGTLQGLKTKLKDGNVVAIIPPVGGG